MEPVNLQKSYSHLNEKLGQHFDARGAKKNFDVPYIDGQNMGDHVSAVGVAANQSGGLGKSFVTTAHHSGGKGWNSGEGATIGHSADSLRHTIIPKNDEHAKAVIDAAQKHLNNIKSLVGDDPVVKTAQGQLDLVKKSDAAGMTLLDFGTFLIQLMLAPNQEVAKKHDATKPGGIHPKPRPPVQAAPAQQAAPDESQPAGEGEAPAEPQEAAAPAGASPAPAPAPSAEAPAPQGQ